MRFPSRTGRLFWFLFWLAVGPLVLIFPASAWLYWTLDPLQKVYLPTYAASSLGAGIPHSEMTIRWVMKTAPRRKAIPASAEDVATGPDPKLPVNLSPKAIADGWRGVAYSAPEKVPADALAEGLRDYVYDDVSGVVVVWPSHAQQPCGVDAALCAPALDEAGFCPKSAAGGTSRAQDQRPGAGIGLAVARHKDGRHPFSIAF